MPLITFTPKGLYCAQGDFYIDPWQPVQRAVITHAHSDHARWGMGAYLAHNDSLPVLRLRLGDDIKVTGVEYAQRKRMNGVTVSLHPAGHVIGSAQVRVSYKGETWVISGDYKTQADRSCTPFEPVKCHHFITESTFGLPVYRWEEDAVLFDRMDRWWAANAAAGKTSVIYAYSFGKAQRVLQSVNPDIGRIFTHGAVENTNEVLREHGIALQATTRVDDSVRKKEYAGGLVIAPPGAQASSWMKRFGPVEDAFASGWMKLRGTRRRRNLGHGFAVSDHADWPGLNQAIAETGAENIYVTHGYTAIFSKWLKEQGYNASVVKTEFSDDGAADPEVAQSALE